MLPAMTYVLRRDTPVAQGGKIVVLEAGLRLSTLDDEVKAQLAPEHFRDDSGGDGLPDDWRDNEDTLAHDKRQREAHEKEAAERAQRKAERNNSVKGG